MGDLTLADFDAYFDAVHGVQEAPDRRRVCAPFPWQRRLLAKVAKDGRWPDLLDLPTGTGKTAAIDVALFHLALDPARAPRRIVLVVDRRTVVSQAFERAEAIAKALMGARTGVLKEIADRLGALADRETPLACVQLRGGMPRDESWARRPDQPVVAVSTVDQAGSRLLFRGYGVSPSMRPIHAGLLGNDTLFLLDEVHLSEPFRQTLEAVREYRAERFRPEQKLALPDRWQFVEMSATPGKDRAAPFTLDEEDRANAVLAKRLAAAKPFERRDPVRVSGGDAVKRATFARAFADEAIRLATPGNVVGVVVNRVTTAQAIYADIDSRLKKTHSGARTLLVTGRMRPLDRDDLDKDLQQFRSGRKRDSGAPPVVVVSTQCIEAGADLDFDALVTECASLDALRQRFGRLNRMGAIDNAQGVVLARADAIGKEPDPIYGLSLSATWEWLASAPTDFGIDVMTPAIAGLGEEQRQSLLAETSRAPVMLPAHLDLWAQTKPTPEVDPDVSLWLHGIDQDAPAEVQIVWRADLTDAMFEAAREDPDALASLLDRVEACAPTALEALSVPLYAVQSWLEATPTPDISDVDGVRAIDADTRPRASKPVLVWEREESEIVEARRLRPGCTIIVPSSRGGIKDGTWDPSSGNAVADLGDRGRWTQTRRAALRLHPKVYPDLPSSLPKPPAADDSATDERATVDAWLGAMKGSGDALKSKHQEWLVEASHNLLRSGKSRYRLLHIDPAATGLEDTEDLETGYFAIAGRFTAPGGQSDVSTEDDGGSLTGVAVTLSQHMEGVEAWTRRFVESCGLPKEVMSDLALAARWHDAGKVDSRFQRWLQGGSAFKTEVAPEPLAKSTVILSDRAARERALTLSRYPRGARHELASVAMLQNAKLLENANDRDLVLHLIASHHGWCRPFAPVVPDPEPVELSLAALGEELRARSDHPLARLDSGIPARFFLLLRRYGWFGLAWLEAILRLADHRRSEEEQRLRDKEAG